MGTPPFPADRQFWLTRDKVEGVLSDNVDVWLAKPESVRCDDGDVLWIAPLGVVDRAATYHSSQTLADAKRECGNGVPFTERECLHIDRGPRGAC